MKDYRAEHAGRAYFFTGSSQYYYRFDGVLRAPLGTFQVKKKIGIGDQGPKYVSLFQSKAIKQTQ